MSRYRWIVIALASFLSTAEAVAGEVSGRVAMPATCSPTVSPAVVSLERIDGKVQRATGDLAADVALVNQRGLQFEPRVQAVQSGQVIRFTNSDNETHNVHILTPGAALNQSMGRGMHVDYPADKPGLLRIVCDVHSHMRGFVVVSPTPYYAVCRPDGSFRLDDVPDGRYRLRVWHEMGEGTTRSLEVKGDTPVALGVLAVEGAPVVASGPSATTRSWSDVIDRIAVLLGEARAVAEKAGGEKKARKLVEDAYFEEFEGSEMEAAVLRHLGFERSGQIEEQFRTQRRLASEVAGKKTTASTMADGARALLLSLGAASQELDRLGVTDRSAIAAASTFAVSRDDSGSGEVEAQERALAKAFEGIASLAASGDRDEAASAMASAYFDVFEPIERSLKARRPQEVLPLEARFNALRGRIGAGLTGADLEADLTGFRGEVSAAIARSRSGGGFGTAFLASLVVILREGIEVILILTMLIALVAKAGQPKALAAIRWGIALAVGASLLTAALLNRLVAASQGKTQEQVEGWVMLVAAGVLFYVSYWLISQVESKRWVEYLKGQVRRGVAAGGFGTLGLAAFLAVYREGAETALIYQSMLGVQGTSNAGLAGLLAGLAVGLVGLAAIYRVIRSTSVKLPLRSFFKVTGLVLFGMSVVFAGNGVFELQNAGILRTTPVEWVGRGVSWLGVYPNAQALSVQGLLLLGAAFALVMLLTDRGEPAPSRPTGVEAGRERVAV